MTKHWLILPVAFVVLAGCDRSGSSNRSGSAPGGGSANAVGKATPVEEAEAEVVRRPDAATVQARLAGRWSRDQDCGRVLEFESDGAMTGFDGKPGRWSVADTGGVAVLTLENDENRATMEIRLIADDEMQWLDIPPGADAEELALQRCG